MQELPPCHFSNFLRVKDSKSSPHNFFRHDESKLQSFDLHNFEAPFESSEQVDFFVESFEPSKKT